MDQKEMTPKSLLYLFSEPSARPAQCGRAQPKEAQTSLIQFPNLNLD